MDFDAKNVTPAGQRARRFIREIAGRNLTLEDLSEEQLEKISELYLRKNLAEQLERAVNASRVDIVQQQEDFVAQYSSLHTRRAYRSSLDRFNLFCRREQADPALLSPEEADRWILSERQSGRSSASIRKDAAALSSFYTFLERRFAFIRNPFRGTKARPKADIDVKKVIPLQDEIQKIISSLPDELGVIVDFLSKTGLRAGALAELAVYNGIMTVKSKGRLLHLPISNEAIDVLKRARLSYASPFRGWSAARIENLLAYYTHKLAREGKIRRPYSVHSLRHFFAVKEYSRDRDIYRVSRLLGHSSVQTTQIYLRGLNQDA